MLNMLKRHDSEKSVLPEHRSERLARVSGRRGKQYFKRQDLLDLGELALVIIDEVVHCRPHAWADDINALHDVLQAHGDGPLRLAMHMAVAAGELSTAAVMRYLGQGGQSVVGRHAC
jgi:hypothetical protein